MIFAAQSSQHVRVLLNPAHAQLVAGLFVFGGVAMCDCQIGTPAAHTRNVERNLVVKFALAISLEIDVQHFCHSVLFALFHSNRSVPVTIPGSNAIRFKSCSVNETKF